MLFFKTIFLCEWSSCQAQLGTHTNRLIPVQSWSHFCSAFLLQKCPAESEYARSCSLCYPMRLSRDYFHLIFHPKSLSQTNNLRREQALIDFAGANPEPILNEILLYVRLHICWRANWAASTASGPNSTGHNELFRPTEPLARPPPSVARPMMKLSGQLIATQTRPKSPREKSYRVLILEKKRTRN